LNKIGIPVTLGELCGLGSSPPIDFIQQFYAPILPFFGFKEHFPGSVTLIRCC